MCLDTLGMTHYPFLSCRITAEYELRKEKVFQVMTSPKFIMPEDESHISKTLQTTRAIWRTWGMECMWSMSSMWKASFNFWTEAPRIIFSSWCRALACPLMTEVLLWKGKRKIPRKYEFLCDVVSSTRLPKTRHVSNQVVCLIIFSELCLVLFAFNIFSCVFPQSFVNRDVFGWKEKQLLRNTSFLKNTFSVFTSNTSN